VVGVTHIDDPALNGTDADLIAMVGAGDGPALMNLYDRYNRQAFGLAFRILGDAATAEEVVQDAFVALWRNAAAFDQTRGGVKSWLLTIVHNRAIDRLRSSASRSGTVELEVADYAGITNDPWDAVADSLDGAQVRQAVAELPEDQRQAIELSYFQGLTHQEISTQYGIPLGTVKGRLRLGLKKLGATLAHSSPSPPGHEPVRDRDGP
jgi:RNA polymerase sigma-70 factor (ECF subfamily)